MVVDSLASYLPQDRRGALATGASLADRVQGAALFADISGFTPATEALVQTLDARRGAEALTRHLDDVYEALIDRVERFGGSVLGFAGDAILCWFEEQSGPAILRAAACALAMQEAAGHFAPIVLADDPAIHLTLKVVVTSGACRRFVVGDPSVQLLDVLAGALVDRMAAGEGLLHGGEVLVDERTAQALGGAVRLGEWRDDRGTGERFALVEALLVTPAETPRPEPCCLTAEDLRPWLLPAVYEREREGLGAFLTELRPAVVLFMHFRGIDYESEGAEAQLDRFVRGVQQVLVRHEGTFLALTIGDKGSYLSAAFGAPVAHEDDDRRAVAAALELRRLAGEQGGFEPVEIGISRGPVRAGAYGAASRRTYSVIGDDVNLAARLMGLAAPGETLISGRVHGSIRSDFTFEPRPPIAVKGKAEPLAVFAVTGELRSSPIRLQEPTYVLPMVGRATELRLLGDKMDLALQGKGQVVGITAAAGMGKSRLVAEVIRLGRRRGFTGFGGACRADGTASSYLVWSNIWRALFELDPDMALRKQLRRLEGEIGELAPDRVDALPLLGEVLGIPIPETDFTQSLEPKERKSALEALLVDCLRAAAAEAREDGEGLMLVLEDVHWIDAVSHDLLEEVARAAADLPILILLAYRPLDLPRLQEPRVQTLPYFTEIVLPELNAAEAEQAIRAKLAQLFPERGGAVPPALIENLTSRAQGNPFYLEELLNYVHDRGLDPRNPADFAHIDLPDSLHRLILSRIDQLTSQQQLVIKVASIIGRVFRFAHLVGYYPALGEPDSLRGILEELGRLDLTPLEAPEPELAYLFKHIITREVAYTSLAEETRAALHEQFAGYLEASFAERPPLDLLAHHYACSGNLDKKREYLRRAGEAAKAAYANDAALDYFSQALAVTPAADVSERYALVLQREELNDLVGERQLQSQDLETLATLAAILDDDRKHIEVALVRAALADTVGDYATVVAQADHAIILAQKTGLPAREAEGHNVWAKALWRQAAYAEARSHLEQALALARAAGAWEQEAASLFTLGVIADKQAHYAEARGFMEQTLASYRQHQDRRGESLVLNSLGVVAYNQRDHEAARRYLDQALRLKRELGDKYAEGVTLNNLGLVALRQHDYVAAQERLAGCLRLCEHVHDREGESAALSSLGSVALQLGDYARARRCLDRSLSLALDIGDREGQAIILAIEGRLALVQGDTGLAETRTRAALDLAREIGEPAVEAEAATNLGHILYGRGALAEAGAAYREAIAVDRDDDLSGQDAEPVAGLAQVALAQGERAEAEAWLEQALRLMQTREFEEVDEPFQVHLICYQVLDALQDPRTPAFLDHSYRLLMEGAARLEDESAARLFLEGVPYHHELVWAWRAQHPAAISP